MAGRRVRCPRCGSSAKVPELLPPVVPLERQEPATEQGPWAESVPALPAVSGDSETVSEPLYELPQREVPVLPPVCADSGRAGKQRSESLPTELPVLPAAGSAGKCQASLPDRSEGHGLAGAPAASPASAVLAASDAPPSPETAKARQATPPPPPAAAHRRLGPPPVRKPQSVGPPVVDGSATSDGPTSNKKGAHTAPPLGKPALAAAEKGTSAASPCQPPPAPRSGALAAAEKGTSAARPGPGVRAQAAKAPPPALPTGHVAKNRAPADGAGTTLPEAILVERCPQPTNRLGLLRRSRRPRREEPSEGNGQRPDARGDRVGERRRHVARRPRLVPPNAYRPDADHVRTVKWLAVFLGLAVLFSLAPVVRFLYLNPETAPGWARVVLLAAAVEAVFIAWMLAAPDWASVWVVMLVFAVVAAMYGMATAIAAATPPHQPLPLGLAEVRTTAASWSGAVMLVMALATYACGRLSAKWRRVYELTHGKRARRSPR